MPKATEAQKRANKKWRSSPDYAQRGREYVYKHRMRKHILKEAFEILCKIELD